MNIEELLLNVKSDDITVEEAVKKLKALPYENIDFARIDHHRKMRKGFPEVIFSQGKTPENLADIFKKLAENNNTVLATRANLEQFNAVKSKYPEVSVEYDEVSKCIYSVKEPIQKKGLVAVCTGGTADIPIAEEAAVTAGLFGAKVKRFYDVGVAGIHRLLNVMPEILEANVIIAAAGMEGAVAGVIAGMADKPVIAVPVSVGYGTGFGGIAPLLTMLNSCAEGMSVVNIDNGFGAGYLAAQINRLISN